MNVTGLSAKYYPHLYLLAYSVSFHKLGGLISQVTGTVHSLCALQFNNPRLTRLVDCYFSTIFTMWGYYFYSRTHAPSKPKCLQTAVIQSYALILETILIFYSDSFERWAFPMRKALLLYHFVIAEKTTQPDHVNGFLTGLIYTFFAVLTSVGHSDKKYVILSLAGLLGIGLKRLGLRPESGELPYRMNSFRENLICLVVAVTIAYLLGRIIQSRTGWRKHTARLTALGLLTFFSLAMSMPYLEIALTLLILRLNAAISDFFGLIILKIVISEILHLTDFMNLLFPMALLGDYFFNLFVIVGVSYLATLARNIDDIDEKPSSSPPVHRLLIEVIEIAGLLLVATTLVLFIINSVDLTPLIACTELVRVGNEIIHRRLWSPFILYVLLKGGLSIILATLDNRLVPILLNFNEGITLSSGYLTYFRLSTTLFGGELNSTGVTDDGASPTIFISVLLTLIFETHLNYCYGVNSRNSDKRITG